MQDDFNYGPVEKDVCAFALYIEDEALKILSRGAKIALQDRVILKQGLEILGWSISGLRDSLVEQMRSCDPSSMNSVYIKIRALMAAVFVIGRSGALSKEAEEIIMAPIKSERSEGGKKGRETAVRQAGKWKEWVGGHVAEMYRNKPNQKATAVRDIILKKTPPAGVCLPNNKDVYEFICAKLRALKQGAAKESLPHELVKPTL